MANPLAGSGAALSDIAYLVIIAACLTAFWLCSTIWRCRKYLHLWVLGRALPGPRRSDDGPTLERSGGLFAFFEALQRRYGPVAAYWKGLTQLNVVVSDPALLGELNLEALDKNVEGLRYLEGLLGAAGIGFLAGQEAKQRRGVWHAVLSAQPFQQRLLPVFVAKVEAALGAWLRGGATNGAPKQEGDPEGPVLEVEGEMRRVWMQLNLDNVFGLGCDVDALPLYSAFGEALALLQARRFAALPLLPFSQPWRQRRRVLAFVHRETDRLIAVARTQASNAAGGLLHEMLEARGPDGRPAFSRQQIHDEVLTLLFGTYDNSNLLSFALHQLACHPDIQERVRGEAAAVWGGPRPATTADLVQLRLTRAVLRETLRICSGAGVVWRQLTQDTRLGPYTLPAGATLVVPSNLLHKDPSVWPHPERFSPERFLAPREPDAPKGPEKPQGQGSEAGGAPQQQSRHQGPAAAGAPEKEQPSCNGEAAAAAAAAVAPASSAPAAYDAKQTPYAFLPFGFGRRACLGQVWALNTASLVLGVLLQRVRLELADPAQRDLPLQERNLTYLSRDGIFLRLVPLQKA